MAAFRPDIPPHVADVIRHLPPDIKRSVKQAIRSLSRDPLSGEPLLRELEGLRKYRVRRFRIVYAVEHRRRMIRISPSAIAVKFTKTSRTKSAALNANVNRTRQYPFSIN